MPGETTRLDVALVDRGIAATRSRAQALIMAGSVLVDGVVVSRAGQKVSGSHDISLRQGPRFVSRGGEKLSHSLTTFEIDAAGLTCADIGASTGGFTDCLLQAGASKVYAIDVGYGQLNVRLRNDPRVVVMERVNARYLDELPEQVSLVTIDVSFISLKLILPVVSKILRESGICIALIKPQFEAGRKQIGKKGVVSDPKVHQEVLENVMEWAREENFEICGLTRSPLKGPEGNIEFLLCLKLGATGETEMNTGLLIDSAMQGV